MFEQTFKNIDDVFWKEGCCSSSIRMIWRQRGPYRLSWSKSYDFIIDKSHHWSRWAAPKLSDGSFDHDTALTGEDLIEYVNDKLFPYLKGFKQHASSPDTVKED